MAAWFGVALPPQIPPATLLPNQVGLAFVTLGTRLTLAGFGVPANDMSTLDGIYDILNDDLDVDNFILTTVLGGSANSPEQTILRLREGIERFSITDINNAAASANAQTEIVVMFDSLSILPEDYNHLPGGSNVLYMDGHVEFIKYPSDGYPVNTGTAFAGWLNRGA